MTATATTTTATTTNRPTAPELMNTEATNYANAAARIAAAAVTTAKHARLSYDLTALEEMTITAYKRWAMKAAKRAANYAAEAKAAGQGTSRWYWATNKAADCAQQAETAAQAIDDLLGETMEDEDGDLL